MFRMRLKIPVALPICSLGSSSMVAVVRGTKTKPIARPATMFGHITLIVAIWRLILPNIKQE